MRVKSCDSAFKMIYKLLFLPVLLVLFAGCDAKRKWDYEPISIETRTSDPNKMDLACRIKRMPKGEFSYDGYLNYAYTVDENTMIEAVAYRSSSGEENDYTLMPWSIAKQTHTKYIQNFYKDMIYSNLGECSTLPEPENAIPWLAANYTFKECVVEGKGMPEIAPQGYYKVVFSATGEVEWGFTAIARIFDKLMP